MTKKGFENLLGLYRHNFEGFLVKTLAFNRLLIIGVINRPHNRYRLFESLVPLGIGIIGKKRYRYRSSMGP